MSVIMALRISVDPERFLEVANGNVERLNAISQRAREHGCIHHRFYANEQGGEILVADEWPDAESFQKFFSSSPDIGEMMGEAGVTQQPQATFWRELDTPDAF